MHLVIGNLAYNYLANLSFSPETDITCQSLPVNQFWCDVITTGDIPVGEVVTLVDEMDQVWARYRITSADHIDKKKVKIKASLDLSVLDESTMDSKMIGTAESGGTALSILVSDVLVPVGIQYTIDSVYGSTPVKGFVKKQTRRERLLWLMFATGGYLAFSWGGGIEIKKLSSEATLIPLAKTFYKPSISYKELTTGVKVTYYSYELGEIDPTDDYVVEEEFTDGSEQGEFIDIRTPYKQTKKKLLIENENVPETAPANVVEIDDITVITPENVSAVADRLAQKYFLHREISVDVINNREYYPGQYVMVYLDRMTIISGYVQSVAFKFGMQARSTLKLVGIEDVAVGGAVTIRYVWQETNTLLEEEQYYPEDYTVSYKAKYLDKTIDNHRYIFRPEHDLYTINSGSAPQTIIINCSVGLDFFEGILHIIDVDGLSNIGEVVVVE